MEGVCPQRPACSYPVFLYLHLATFLHLFIYFRYYFMLGMFCLHTCACIVCVSGRRSEEGIRSPGAGITNGWIQGGSEKLYPGPREEQPMLLTAKPSLQPLAFVFEPRSLHTGQAAFNSWSFYVSLQDTGITHIHRHT